ncbi:MAG: HD domain-containing protein [Mariniblastus sp.]|nr:HD domain-containing protein [Mariniblastus sp.]
MSLTGSGFRDSVQAARERWQQGRDKIRTLHEEGASGRRVVNALSDLLDHILLGLYRSCLEDFSPEIGANVSFILHGGCGRREVAPYSDVDSMLLYQGSLSDEMSEFSRRIAQDITDAGFQSGFSLRTPRDACSMSLKDAAVFSSLTESRFLGGNPELYENYLSRLQRLASRRSTNLIRGIVEARERERLEFGETVYLLRPNVKKSRGGLRDVHLIRWLGFVRFGETDIDQLCRRRALFGVEATRLQASAEFLLRLRNELHWAASRANDGFGRNEQVRIAEKFGYVGDDAVLPVEKLMQDYFRYSSQIRNIGDNFVAKSLNRSSFATNVFAPLVTRQIGENFLMGPLHIGVNKATLENVQGDLSQVLRLMQLAAVHEKKIDYTTWDAIRRTMSNKPEIELTRQSAEQFMALLANTRMLADLLKLLHEMRVLEKILPDFKHARGLLQFNEYHKYTVDEHTLRAIAILTDFEQEPSDKGKAYRSIRDKNLLHLALLLHDLGKGYPEDHCEVGRRIAIASGERLWLSDEDTETIKFLVQNHLVMTHLAFHRDINDEEMVAEFAANVGSVRLLSMLYVLTCADVDAVGPGVLTAWKLGLLTDLYRHAKNILTGHRDDDRYESQQVEFSEQIAATSTDADISAWLSHAAQNLPRNYCEQHDAEFISKQLIELRETISDKVQCYVGRVKDTNLIELCIGKREKRRAGIFYRVTGLLASLGLSITSVDIKPIGDSLIFYWFKFADRDFDNPPQSRLDEIQKRALDVVTGGDREPPQFRTKWKKRGGGRALQLSRPRIEVKIDNQTVDSATIIDVFAYKKIGLLYRISEKLHELGLDVNYARISTYAHQLIAVFYVADEQGNKVRNKNQLHVIQQEVLRETSEFLTQED